MDHVLLHEAMKLNKERKRKKRWQQVVSCMAAIVVFCTTYALILPAITMEKDPICGQEAHEHEVSCFGIQAVDLISCAFQSHQHTDACRDAMQNLICGYGECVIHTHNELCSDTEGNLVCSLPQISAHTHGPDCYAPISELADTPEETEGHIHTNSCYPEQTAYSCGLEKIEPHIHSEACFEKAQTLTCTVQEAEGHAHSESCYGTEKELACSLTEAPAHTHDESCFTLQSQISCGLEEAEAHVHGEGCYTARTGYICGLEEALAHVHADGCYAVQSQSICGMEEIAPHAHGEGCYTMQSIVGCGLDEEAPHTHGEGCYLSQSQLVCIDQELPAHTHEAQCFDGEGNQTCTLAETQGHAHGESCYQMVDQLICQLAETQGHAHSQQCNVDLQVLTCTLAETEGHTHSGTCTQEVQVLICTQVETQGHAHTDACIQEIQDLSCSKAETEGHTHGEACTQETKVQICILKETEGHAHSETCYKDSQKLICQIEEIAGHTHAESCYTEQEQLVCTVVETEGHIHTEICGPIQPEPICQLEATQETAAPVMVLVCELPEVTVHTHTETCFDEAGTLICPIICAAVHDHTEACLNIQEPEKVLICEKEIHVHSDECYPEEENIPEESPYICGMGIHVHTEACQDEEAKLTCTIPEHTRHTAACMVEDFDETADLESQEIWEATLADVKLTGNWPTDVLAIGASQLGYTESAKNLYLDEAGKLTGYTRYGAWYGSPYGDWCAMFTSFCMHYAGVENVPLGAGCTTWIGELTEAGLYHTADSYTPKPGDLIFFDWEYYEGAPLDSDHVGFVAGVIPATEDTPAQIITLEGNSSEQVEYNTYDLPDSTIIGYGEMPVGDTIILKNQGEDYTVTATFSVDAGIPATAELQVREILQGTEEYDSYYAQAIATVADQVSLESEDDLDVSFARFFDIHFLVDGESIEPMDSVDIQIRYGNAVAKGDDESGIAVHFADEGIEILDAQTSQAEQDPGQVDTFEFTQNSFSVTGTMLLAADDTITTGTRVDFSDLDGSGSTYYVVYTRLGNGAYYALKCNDNGSVQAVPVTVNANDGTISWSNAYAGNGMFWSFAKQSDQNMYLIANVGHSRYMHSYDNNTGVGVTTSGAYPSELITGANETFKVKSNSDFSYLTTSNGNATFSVTQNQNTASNYYIAKVERTNFHVWVDGTNGGMMSYSGSKDLHYDVAANGTFTLPTAETFTPPTKYDYRLRGWYNIKTNTYHRPGETVTITCDSVFYADWIADSYNVGQNNASAINSLDTHEFITTHVFDYSILFNMQSVTHTGTVGKNSHSETWSLVQPGNNPNTVPYQNDLTLDFFFRDWDAANSDLSYPANSDKWNNLDTNNITEGIVDQVDRIKDGRSLLDVLFSTTNAFNAADKSGIIGKTYVGEGNYLFQYMEEGMSNYDNEHNGYYYYDSKLNAASYNQSENRFYVYNYLERTSDSAGTSGEGQYSDFLPFNSPYANTNNLNVVRYTDNHGRLSYEYDAKGDLDGNVGTNYHFGMNTNIHFYLPNDCGWTDAYDNLGNLSTTGEHMIFEFHGDDDVWVFVDGELLLDVGGVHGVLHGTIDFSRGVVTTVDAGGTTTKSFEEILGHNIEEGAHNLSFYYLERGSSQSNCAIYFNLAPRYSLELEKRDYFSGELLNGATFGVYTEESCAAGTEAQLWLSHEDAKNNVAPTNKFTVENGKLTMFGFVAGKTYYIKEITQPAGYIDTDDIIRLSLNNRGLSTSEITVLRGENNVREDGFEVISNYLNDETQTVHLVISNQLETPNNLRVRVEKDWANGSVNIPESVTVYLLANGVRSGRPVELNATNGWTHTWIGLAEKDEYGADIHYSVEEVGVPGFTSTVEIGTLTRGETVVWTKVGIVEDGETYMLTYNGNALVLNSNRTFGWVDIDSLGTGHQYQWSATASGDGFILSNGGYKLTLDGTTRYTATNGTGNQILHYDGTSIFGLNSNIQYELGNIVNGYPQAVAASETTGGLDIELLRMDTYVGGYQLIGVTNTPIPEEKQTELNVEKLWQTKEDITDKSVTIRLLADGEDTGRTLILNKANDWKGTFDGLAYYQEDGKTPVSYTIQEDELTGYVAQYSDITVNPGATHNVWAVQSALTAGETYHFTSGGFALATNYNNQLVAVTPDQNDPYQQWKYVSVNGTMVLENVQTGNYLRYSNNNVNIGVMNYSAVSLANGHLAVAASNGSWRYITISNRAAISAVSNVGSASSFLTYEKTAVPSANTYSITVTNIEGAYKLPETGGIGTDVHTFGGLLILAAALMYTTNSLRKRRRGEGD